MVVCSKTWPSAKSNTVFKFQTWEIAKISNLGCFINLLRNFTFSFKYLQFYIHRNSIDTATCKHILHKHVWIESLVYTILCKWSQHQNSQRQGYEKYITVAHQTRHVTWPVCGILTACDRSPIPSQIYSTDEHKWWLLGLCVLCSEIKHRSPFMPWLFFTRLELVTPHLMPNTGCPVYQKLNNLGSHYSISGKLPGASESITSFTIEKMTTPSTTWRHHR